MNSPGIHCNKWLLSVAAAGLVLLSGLSGMTRAHAAEDDLQMWIPVTLQLPVTEKVYLSTTVEPRLDNNMRDIGTLLIRPGVYVDLNEHLSAGVTMDYDTFYNPRFREEYRLGEEILLRHKLGKFPVSHRLRLEQRWLEGANTLNRLRIRNEIRYPLPKGTWYLVGRNEYMVNLNSTTNGPNGGFDQNRLFGGMGRNIGERTNVEGGYQWTWFNQPPGGGDLMAHTIYVKVVFNFRQ